FRLRVTFFSSISDQDAFGTGPSEAAHYRGNFDLEPMKAFDPSITDVSAMARSLFNKTRSRDRNR
ncbi:MAG: hypothetical protein AAFY24_18710, partial [Pseudomonadota bacterium]